MALNNIIGWQIRRIRIAKGMTIDQLASALPKSSTLTSEQINQMELGTRKVLDYQVQAISQALKVSVEDLYATPPRDSLPEDLEAWKILAQLEDIISGIEAQADNLGINMEEARQWWQKAKRLIDKRNLTLSKPSKASVADQKSIPSRNGGRNRSQNE